mgnify:CR=1 FL=1
MVPEAIIAIRHLKKAAKNSDTETAHANADKVLCVLLKLLGYGSVVEAWEKVKKWYS